MKNENRTLKVFKNLSELRQYEAEGHKMGAHWSYDSSDFNGEYDDEYKDYIAVCAYEYK